MVEKRPGLRLLRGGREPIRVGALRVSVAPATDPPFEPAAVVVEEDTWQVLSADPRVRPPDEHPVRLLTGLMDAEPLTPGSVLLRGGPPLQLLTVVYDFDREPCCRPEWVEAAFAEIFRTAAERQLPSLALPLLGVRHGRLQPAAALGRLLTILKGFPPGRLRRLWLIVPAETISEVAARLLREEKHAGQSPPGPAALVTTKSTTKENVMDPRIEKFLAAEAFGVAGASTNRDKYGNRVLRCYLQNGRKAIPINPRADEIEGIPCVASVAELPAEVKSLSVITPPKITDEVVKEAIRKGIENIWMQPGAESPVAVEMCRRAGVNIIADGSCILVVMHYHEH